MPRAGLDNMSALMGGQHRTASDRVNRALLTRKGNKGIIGETPWGPKSRFWYIFDYFW